MTRLYYSLKKELVTACIELPILAAAFVFSFPLRVKHFFLRPNIPIQKQKILLLGNGPSIRESIDKVIASRSKYDLLMVNNAPLSDSFYNLRPEYLCIIDSMYWLDLDSLNPVISNNIERFFSQLNQVNWPLNVFVPEISKNIVSQRIANDNITITAMSSAQYDFDSLFVARLALLAGFSPPRVNVLVSSIHAIIGLGYLEAKILGAEMDRIKSLEVDQLSNQTSFNIEYFYNDKGVQFSFQNKRKNCKGLPVHIRFSREASTFKWFALLAQFARHKGVALSNASSYSLIDSIDRGHLQ